MNRPIQPDSNDFRWKNDQSSNSATTKPNRVQGSSSDHTKILVGLKDEGHHPQNKKLDQKFTTISNNRIELNLGFISNRNQVGGRSQQCERGHKIGQTPTPKLRPLLPLTRKSNCLYRISSY
jgi:hypothetical protein